MSFIDSYYSEACLDTRKEVGMSQVKGKLCWKQDYHYLSDRGDCSSETVKATPND